MGAAKAVADGRSPESGAYDYPISVPWDETEKKEVVGGCLKVDGLPLGFTLLSRAMLETMCDHYAATLTFDDVVEGKSAPTVALFQLMIEPNPRDGRRLLGEDYSFAARWRAIGGEVFLFLGPDSELAHVGTIVMQGTREGFFR